MMLEYQKLKLAFVSDSKALRFLEPVPNDGVTEPADADRSTSTTPTSEPEKRDRLASRSARQQM